MHIYNDTLQFQCTTTLSHVGKSSRHIDCARCGQGVRMIVVALTSRSRSCMGEVIDVCISSECSGA